MQDRERGTELQPLEEASQALSGAAGSALIPQVCGALHQCALLTHLACRVPANESW